MFAGIANRFRPLTVAWLTFMWILLMGQISWGNLVAGLGLSLLIVLALPLPPVPRSGNRVNWFKLVAFVAEWFFDLLVASAKVAWLSLRRAPQPRNAVLRVPMRLSNELVLYLATCAYNLQPGGAVTDIDLANREWTVHILDADSDAAIAREIASVQKLERQMIAIFEGGR